MAKSKKRKKSAKKQTGFFAKVFDVFTALVILAVIFSIVYYFVFFDTGTSGSEDPDRKVVAKEIEEKPVGIKEIKSGKVTEPVIDEKADQEERDRIHQDLYGIEEDEFIAQHEEELLSNITGGNDSSVYPKGFYSSVDKWARKYTGMKLVNGADPDKNGATDNSHLICSIWKNAAKENGMYFEGYIPTDIILNNVTEITADEVSNGDLLVLNDGMIGIVTNFVSLSDYKLVYASANEKKVISVPSGQLVHYWLKPENFKGYYRINKNILS
ncbi:MAG: hypothetical protein JXN63_00430 [Candidatus Delongbacteria bacterium]|nr:hypothetical protein [Candidatus Delongbacteria bacterium]